jgi:hypothetical protein
MFFAKVGWRRGVRRSGFEQIEQGIAGAKRHNVVSGFGLCLLFHRKAELLAVKSPHGGQVSRHQSNVIKAFVGEHLLILSLQCDGRKWFLALQVYAEGSMNTLQLNAERRLSGLSAEIDRITPEC